MGRDGEPRPQLRADLLYTLQELLITQRLSTGATRPPPQSCLPD